MTATLDNDQLRQLRIRAQALIPRPAPTLVVAMAQQVVGLQAQNATAAGLALRARGSAGGATAVEHALVEERSIVRTWEMRGTLHLLAANDVGWLVALLGPSALARAQRRYAELGVDGETGVQGVRLIRDALARRGPLTRTELATCLAPHGIPTAGQAIMHLIGQAALEGVLCLGPPRGRAPTYVLIDDWIDRGRALAHDTALAELARRYLAAFGPAGPEDLASWSGLPMREIRSGWQRLAGELREVVTADGPAWLLAKHVGWLTEAGGSPVVRLVASFDSYLLGYRNRRLIVAPQHARRVHPGGGILRAVLLVDGRALGVWRLIRRPARLEVVVEPFESLSSEVLAGIEDEVTAIGQFLDLPSALQLRPPTS